MKNLLLYSLVVFLSLPGFAQKKFSIRGKVMGKEVGYLYLAYSDGGASKIDSAVIQNGHFLFEGPLSEPTRANFIGDRNVRDFYDPSMTSIFLEPTAMEMTVTYGDFKNLVLKGSPSNDEFDALKREKEPIEKEMEPLRMASKNEKNPEKAAAIREQLKPFNTRMDMVDEAFIRAHPDSYISAYLIRFMLGTLKPSEAKAIYNGWTERIKNSTTGKLAYSEILALENGLVGSIAKTFSTTDINGEKLSLIDFRNKKYVLIDFWASWCAPCRKGNPHLLSLYNKYKAQGFEIVGVSDDNDNPSAWKKAVESDQIGVWKHVLRGGKVSGSGSGITTDIVKDYGIRSFPSKILIDKEGVIIGRYGLGAENDDALDKKLAEIFNNKDRW